MPVCSIGERSRKNQGAIREIRKLHVLSVGLDLRLNKPVLLSAGLGQLTTAEFFPILSHQKTEQERDSSCCPNT